MSTTLAEQIVGNPSGNVGTSGTVRYYSTADFTSIEGILYKGGSVGSRDYFLSNTWSLNGDGQIVAPPIGDFPTTNDGLPHGARITATLYDSNGKNIGNLFTNWQIPTGTLLTREFLIGYNGLAQPLRSIDTLSRVDFLLMLQQYIAAVLPAPDASNLLKGIGFTDVAPLSAGSPIFIGLNSRRVQDAYNVKATAIGAVGDGATNDRAALNTLVNTTMQIAGAGGDVYLPAGDYSIQSNMTFPANVRLNFDPRARLKPANGVAITILGSINADPFQIFTNATAGLGTVSFSGNVVLSEVIAEWWGAKGDNSTDSGTAINAAIAAVKTMTSGKMKSLGGIYRSTILITYTGTSASQIIWEGVGQPRGAASGTTIRYSGAVGGTLVSWKGANNSTFRDIAFDGGGLALKTVVIDYDSSGGVGSSGVAFENVTITGATGAGSIDLTLGTSTTQTSEVRIYNLTLSGYGSPSTAERGLKTTASNVKNFLISGLSCLNYSVAGIEYGGSGTFTLVEPIFALNAIDIKRTASTGSLTIIGGESESGNKFISGQNSGNPGTLTIIGTYWQGSTAADDYVISDGANMDIRNSEFYNDRTGSSVAKIQTLANSTSPGMLISEGNVFQYATDHTPFYDSSNNDIFSTYTTSNTNQWRIRSFGDIGGTSGTSWPKLKPWVLDSQTLNYLGGAGINASGVLASSGTAGVGYATGAGGTVTQSTDKSTGVTLNKTTGTITTNNAALAAAAEVSFIVTNSTVAATDVPVAAIRSGGTLGAYAVQVSAVGAGSFTITISNLTAGSLSEALVLSFAVIKGVAA